MRQRRSLRLVAFATLACAVWLGCNAILGNESAEFDPEAAARLDGSSGGDSTSGDGTTNNDGSSSGGDASVDGDADAGPCNGADLLTSGDHCGSCGHSCRGGGCANGKCQPVTIATDEVGPSSIAIDATHVYWINVTSGDVWSVPIAGGAKVKLYDGPSDTGGNSIATFDGGVYFGSSDIDAGVFRCAAPTCAGGPAFEVPNLDSPTAIAITDAGALYFVEFQNGGGIQRCQLPCGAGRDVIVPNGQGFPDHVAVLGDAVYWTTITPFPPRMRTKDSTGSPVGIANGPIESILPTPTEVYFIEQGLGPSAVNVDGGAVRRLRDIGSQGVHMVFFESSVLVTEANANYVYTCALTGCGDAGVVLASGQNKPRGVAFDATYIYWANEGTAGSGGSIMRLAR